MEQSSVEQSCMDRPYSYVNLKTQGSKPESCFLFFYSHHRSTGPQALLSNFWLCSKPFKDSQDRQFPTSEHYMMHGKAILFGDEETASAILSVANPRAAKALGRKVRNFDDDVWMQHRLEIVTEGCFLKFSQCDKAKRFLLASCARILVEAAQNDRIWGIGMNANNPYRCDLSKWRGTNLLGEALMTVPDRLREQQSADEKE